MSGVIRKVTCPDSSPCFPESSLPAVNILNCASRGGCQPAQFLLMTEALPSTHPPARERKKEKSKIKSWRGWSERGSSQTTRVPTGFLGIVFATGKGNIVEGQVTTLLGRELGQNREWGEKRSLPRSVHRPTGGRSSLPSSSLLAPPRKLPGGRSGTTLHKKKYLNEAPVWPGSW